MGRMAMASSRTTGRFSIVPTARIADSGWLMMGVPNSSPKTPELVSVKVDPPELHRERVSWRGRARRGR